MTRSELTVRLLRWFEGIMPNRTKRLMCLASLSAYMKGSTSLDAETITKLNNVMVLSSEDSALKLPVELSKAIWNGPDGKELISTDVFNLDIIRQRAPTTLRAAVNAVVAGIPSWMRYADDAEMIADVTKLLATSPQVLGID